MDINVSFKVRLYQKRNGELILLFSLMLKNARQEKNLTQIDLIRKIHDELGVDISTSMLSRYEDETAEMPRRISIKAIFALAVYLDLDLNKIAKDEIKAIKK